MDGILYECEIEIEFRFKFERTLSLSLWVGVCTHEDEVRERGKRG